MVTKPKATIISVYFGKLPYYFEFTKKTIQHNKNFQWIIAGDMFPEKVEDGNILFLPYTLDNLSEDCSKVLKCSIKIATAYKTCDAKPLFPEIFEKYISSDWVGWADLDCIFGDLDTFVTADVMDNYEVFTYLANSVFNFSYKTPHGPFTLINNKKIKQWYLKIENLNEKLNYINPHSSDLRSSSKFLDEAEFGKIIHDEQYKVYTKYKPYADKNIELPIVFNGRRRAPARWVDGKIYIDSILEDYQGRFDDIHSMFLHIRSGIYVDIINNCILPEALHFYMEKTHIHVYTNVDVYKFIKEIIPTLKYLTFKNKNVIFSFNSQNYEKYATVIELLAPEVNLNLNNRDKINELSKLLHLTQISPTIIEDMKTKIAKQPFPEKVVILRESNTIPDDNVYFLNNLTILDLLSIFSNSKEITADIDTERSLVVLMSENTIYTDITLDKKEDYSKIFKQLASITAKKREYIKK